MEGFENRRYLIYIYVGGNRGIQGIVRVDAEKGALEPINTNIYEGFINTYTLYDACAIFEDIQNKLNKIYSGGVWKLSDSHLVMRKHYLQLLVDYKISHMSICMHNSLYVSNPYEGFISRLDCLDEEQFRYITRVLKEELSVAEHSGYKLYELPIFKWEGM